MSMSDLAYDIEQMYIDGYSPKTIASLLECPLETVYAWLEENGLKSAASYDPHDTVNS